MKTARELAQLIVTIDPPYCTEGRDLYIAGEPIWNFHGGEALQIEAEQMYNKIVQSVEALLLTEMSK